MSEVHRVPIEAERKVLFRCGKMSASIIEGASPYEYRASIYGNTRHGLTAADLRDLAKACDAAAAHAETNHGAKR